MFYGSRSWHLDTTHRCSKLLSFFWRRPDIWELILRWLDGLLRVVIFRSILIEKAKWVWHTKFFWKKVQIREVAPVLIKCYNQLFWFPSSEIWLDFGVKIIFQKIELFICLWYNLASVIFLLHYFSIFSLLEWPNLSWVYFSHFLCFGHSIGQWWMPISIENRSPLKVRRWKK